MELKKSPKVDLENKKGLFLEIGLVVSLALVILLFSVSQKEKVIQEVTFVDDLVQQELVEVTRQDEQKPPEPVTQAVTVVTDIINVVQNDTQITTNLSFAEFNEEEIVVQQVAVVEEVIEEDAPFIRVEQMPTFRGGDLNSFRTWVMGQLRYPSIAQENGIAGRVTLTFVIERDGSLTNIQVLQSPDRSLSDEAIRVLRTSPKWAPGLQRNVPVRVSYTLPVEFILNE